MIVVMEHDSETHSDRQTPAPLFEALLTPHRSLPPVGFLIVMGILIAISVAIGVGFSLVGAWPVFGFLGIDILLVYVAFRISYAASRQSQHVRLSTDALEIAFLNPGGRDRHAVLQPYWARVDVEPITASRNRLVVRSRGDVVELGAFLATEEKLAFAQVLREALRQARDPIPSQGLGS